MTAWASWATWAAAWVPLLLAGAAIFAAWLIGR